MVSGGFAGWILNRGFIARYGISIFNFLRNSILFSTWLFCFIFLPTLHESKKLIYTQGYWNKNTQRQCSYSYTLKLYFIKLILLSINRPWQFYISPKIVADTFYGKKIIVSFSYNKCHSYFTELYKSNCIILCDRGNVFFITAASNYLLSKTTRIVLPL